MGPIKGLSREQKEAAYQEVAPIAQQFRQELLPPSQKVENSFRLLEDKLGFFTISESI